MKIAVASLGNFHANPYGPELQVKQMLDWRCARGKRRKYSSKKRIVCQEEKRLFVKKQYERIGLSNGEEFLREEEF